MIKLNVILIKNPTEFFMEVDKLMTKKKSLDGAKSQEKLSQC